VVYRWQEVFVVVRLRICILALLVKIDIVEDQKPTHIPR